MRKIYVFNMVTIDGYFEGLNHDISWHNIDEEFQDFAITQLNETETILFGRVTYEMMASFWTSEEALKTDPETAKLMSEKEKFVFSRTIDKAEWQNTTLVKENVIEKLNHLKQTEGKDIAIFGSSNLSLSLIENNLVDEFRLIVNPVILGQGVPLFSGLKTKLNVNLLSSKQFKNGNILNVYGKV